MTEVNLKSPFISFATKIKYTYGLSEYIIVNDIIRNGDRYALTINVHDDSIAIGLEVLLPKTQNFGGVILEIIIFNSTGTIVPESNTEYTPETLADTFHTVLSSNPIFIGSVMTDGKIPEISSEIIGNIAIIIKPEVVLFNNDDIYDLCGNYAEVTTKVFKELTTINYLPNLKVSFSTYDKNSKLQKSLYSPTHSE